VARCAEEECQTCNRPPPPLMIVTLSVRGARVLSEIVGTDAGSAGIESDEFIDRSCPRLNQYFRLFTRKSRPYRASLTPR